MFHNQRTSGHLAMPDMDAKACRASRGRKYILRHFRPQCQLKPSTPTFVNRQQDFNLPSSDQRRKSTHYNHHAFHREDLHIRLPFSSPGQQTKSPRSSPLSLAPTPPSPLWPTLWLELVQCHRLTRSQSPVTQSQQSHRSD